MCVGQLGSECAAGGFVLSVWDSWGVSVQQVALCCEWDSWGSECVACGFVLRVGQLGE